MQSDEGKPQERSQPRPTVGNGEAEEEDSFINISANVTKDDWDIADIRKKNSNGKRILQEARQHLDGHGYK